MFNAALRWELYEGKNPAASPGMLPRVHRDKYLTAAETQALVRALDADKDQTAAGALALLIVTGARRSEALLATWENVDFDRGMLTVPRSKNGRPRHIPLSAFAVCILERQAGPARAGQPVRVPEPARPGRPLEGCGALGPGEGGGRPAG